MVSCNASTWKLATVGSKGSRHARIRMTHNFYNGIYNASDRLWTNLKNVLRTRHLIKFKLLSILLIDKGGLRPYAHSYKILGPREYFLRQSVRIYKSRDFFLDIQEKHYHFEEPCVVTLKVAHVLGPYSVPFVKNKLATEHLRGNKVATLTLPILKYIRSRLTHVQQSFNDIFFINMPYCHNFYHWFFDCLILLRQYEAYRLTDPDCKLMINGWNPWQRRSLELLGYHEDQYFPWAYEHGLVNNLVISEATHSQVSIVRTGDLLWLRERLLLNDLDGKQSVCSKKYSDRVFVSRRDARKGTRLSNEAILAKRLSILGFSEYILGNMPLDDQIELFSNAKIVVAAHGAGLTNIIYMRKGKVFEIHTDNCFRDHFFNISQQLNLDYYGILAWEKHRGEFEVDEEFLVAAVSSALEKSPMRWSNEIARQ